MWAESCVRAWGRGGTGYCSVLFCRDACFLGGREGLEARQVKWVRSTGPCRMEVGDSAVPRPNPAPLIVG